MIRRQTSLLGVLGAAQALHIFAFALLWTGILPQMTASLSWLVFLLVGWNLLLAVQAVKRFPATEPYSTVYVMACGLRLLVFTCAILLPAHQFHAPPAVWGSFPVSIGTCLLMHWLGLVTLLRLPKGV